MSNQVKRYFYTHDVAIPTDDGLYVEYSDYQSMTSKLEKTQKELYEMVERFGLVHSFLTIAQKLEVQTILDRRNEYRKQEQQNEQG